MPGGTWADTVRNQSAGGYGYQAPKPASPFDAANVALRGGGEPNDFGRGANAVQKRQFADVGKVNINLLDPLARSRAATNYQPVDGADGGLLGIGNYYNGLQPGGLFAGLGAAVGQTLGGLFGEGGAKGGSDVGTFIGKTLEMPMALVGSAGVPFVAPVIDSLNSEIEKYTPYILRDTLKIPTNVGGAFQSMLNIFGLAGMGVERTYAGMGNRGELPKDIQERMDKGELTHDQALDELVLSNRGYSNDGIHNLVWNLLLDPANWASLGVGAVGGAVRGTGVIARSFGAAVRADEALAARLIGQGGRIGEIAKVAQEGGAITDLVDSRGTLAQMRNIMDDAGSPFHLKMVEKLGMSALGPVGEETGNVVAKVGHYILKATDPVNFFSGSKAGQRSMQFLTTAASTAAIAAYKPLVVRRLTKMADSILEGGSEQVYRSLGVNGANAMQEHVLSDLATNAMQAGAIPRTGKLSAAEAARELLRGGAYDSNIGKYIEVQIERNKDISVGMLPPQQMYDESVQKFAALLGVHPDKVAAKMTSVTSDDAILIHALYYYFKGEALHTGVLHALRAAKEAGNLVADLDPERIALISSKTLTNKTVDSLEQVMKTGDVGAIRQEVEKYNDFNWIHNKNVPDGELKDTVQQWLDVHKPHLVQEVDLIDPATGLPRTNIPQELQDWATDGETFGYKLGQKMPGDVPEEAAWRVTRAPGPDGEMLNVNPYSDFWVEGGDSARKVGIFGAVNMAMTRGIRQERIIWSQRRRFITDMASAATDPKTGEAIEGAVNIPPALGDRIFKALMYEAKDRFIQPRGMEPREMYQTAKRVLDDARKTNSAYDNLATKLTERQVVLTLLRATEGEVGLVGVTQKVTGGIKAYAPGSGANYWGRISERLYPLMRFTLNPVFQTMEAVEPYVLNSMRGIWVPLKRDSEKYQNALATRNAISQLIHSSSDPDGIAAETAEALAVQAYQGSEAASKFGRGKISRWMPHIGERKDVAAAMETERIMGDHMYQAFKAIKGDEFEAFWGDLEWSFGTSNRGQIAKRWMAANFALQDVNGFQVATIDDILKMKTLGKRLRLNKGGDKGAYSFGDVEVVFDHVRSYDSSWTQGLRRERGLAPGEALLEDLRSMTREEWHAEVERSGLNTDNLTRVSERTADDIWHMANGPEVGEFWKGYRKSYLQGITGQGATPGETAIWTRLARDQEIIHARALVNAAAMAKGMTEEEFIKLHFEDIPRALQDASSITGGTLFEVREAWAEQALSHKWATVDPVDGEVLKAAYDNGESHPAMAHLNSVDTRDEGFFLMKMPGWYLENLQDALATGGNWYRGDLPTRGYSARDSLLADIRYGDTILRIPKQAVDNAGFIEDNIDLIDRHSIEPTDFEVLTPQGWSNIRASRGGNIQPAPVTRTVNPEVAVGQTIYPHDVTLPENQSAGINKLDIESIHQNVEERNAVDFYTGSGYMEVNPFLRGVTGPLGSYGRMSQTELWKTIEHLDRAVAKGQTRVRTTLYRGLNLSNAKQRGDDLTINYENLYPEGQGPAGAEHTFRDPAFFSSSREERKARDFAGEIDPDYESPDDHIGVVLKIDAPAGTHLHVHEGYEDELLWGRGVSFRVTKRRVSVTSNHGTTIHLDIEPISEPVKPGVNRLALGEMPVALRNEGRFLQDATQHPEGLRGQYHLAHNDMIDYDEADAMQEAIEKGISKAEAAKPGERVTYGPHVYGARTVEEGLAEITDNMDSDEITIARGALADIRNRADRLMESESWGTTKMAIKNHNNVRLLASLAAGIAAEGGTRYGLNKVLEVMEILWTRGPSAITDPNVDAVTKEIGTHLVRGIMYGIEDPVLTNRGNDALDAVLGNTSRRATGRLDTVQPVLADDFAAEAAGYLTPAAYDDLVEQGVINAVPPASAALDAAGKPGLAAALDAVKHGGPTVAQREYGDNVRDYLEGAGLQRAFRGGPNATDPVIYRGEPNGFQLVPPKNNDGTWYAFAFDEVGHPVVGIQMRGPRGATEPNYIVGVSNVSQGHPTKAAPELSGGWIKTKGYGTRLYDWLQDQTDINMYPMTGRETTPQGHRFSSRWLEHRRALAMGEKPAEVAPTEVIPTGTLPATGAHLGGSTGPIQVRDPETGKLYVDKRGANPLHVVEEHNADTVYEALGVPVAPHTMLEGADTVKRSVMIEGAQTLKQFAATASDEELRPVVDQIQRHFALDALLANWDVIGLEGDNIIVKNGVPYRIDNGGSLRYRAMGDPKGEHFGTVVTELQRMRHGGNQWAEDVFGELTDEEVRRQVLDLGPQMDIIITSLPPSLRETVWLRYKDMLAQTDHITPAPPKGGAVEVALPPRPAELGEYEHEHIVDHFNRMAQAANEQGFNGRSTWTAAEMASVAGRARQKLGRRASAVDVWELRRAETQIRLGLSPGPGMEEFAPLFEILQQKRYRAERQRVLVGGMNALHLALRDELGHVIERGDPAGIGLFDGDGPSRLFAPHILGTGPGGETAAEALAYATGQSNLKTWRLGPNPAEITDPRGYTARASVYIPPSDLTPKMAEMVAEAIGKGLPEALDVTVTRGANNTWHLQIMDTTGDLFPRAEDGFVQEDALNDFLSDIILKSEPTPGAFRDIEKSDLQLAVEYGDYTHINPPRHTAETAMLTGEVEGDVDWGLFAQQIETRSAERGAPIRASALRNIRASYQSAIESELRNAAPRQWERIKNGTPISGRDLEDRRGGDILGITSPRAGAAAVIRGFAEADALTGVHELVHVFSIAGMDHSLRDVVSKAMDEYHVANDAAKQAKLAILQQKLAATTNPGWRNRYQSDIVALTHDLQTPHPTDWGPEQEEFFVHAVLDWIDRGVPDNPELANAFNHFRNWITVTKKELGKPGMVPLTTSPQMDALLNRMFSRPGVDTVSYSVEQQTMRMAGQQVMRSAWDEAHATQFYKRDRSMVERSINHPYIGLYPASYMWGKILPEMLRFLALRPFGMETPFLAWNVAREVSDSVRAQAELDPGFKDWLDGNKDAFMLFSMLFPGLPHDIPANASLPVRRIAEQGLVNQQAYARGVNPADVKDVDYGRGAQDAIQYALGPLGTIRTVSEVASMGGNFVRSTLGSAQDVFTQQQESVDNLPLR